MPENGMPTEQEGLLEKLRGLAAERDAGVLSPEQFEARAAELLSPQSHQAPEQTPPPRGEDPPPSAHSEARGDIFSAFPDPAAPVVGAQTVPPLAATWSAGPDLEHPPSDVASPSSERTELSRRGPVAPAPAPRAPVARAPDGVAVSISFAPVATETQSNLVPIPEEGMSAPVLRPAPRPRQGPRGRHVRQRHTRKQAAAPSSAQAPPASAAKDVAVAIPDELGAEAIGDPDDGVSGVPRAPAAYVRVTSPHSDEAEAELPAPSVFRGGMTGSYWDRSGRLRFRMQREDDTTGPVASGGYWDRTARPRPTFRAPPAQQEPHPRPGGYWDRSLLRRS